MNELNKTNWKDINALRIIVATFGVMLGISGMFAHGLYEILQGNTPTNGFFINAIGEKQQTWKYGTEGAFTVIPNFLLTGIAAMAVGLIIIIWSLLFVHKKNGPQMFLLLFILLFSVGGGIGQIAFFIPTVIYASKLTKPQEWWENKKEVKGSRPKLAKIWVPALIITVVSFLIGIVISLTGYVPGTTDPEIIINVCWAFVFGSLIPLFISFKARIAHEIEKRI